MYKVVTNSTLLFSSPFCVQPCFHLNFAPSTRWFVGTEGVSLVRPAITSWITCKTIWRSKIVCSSGFRDKQSDCDKCLERSVLKPLASKLKMKVAKKAHPKRSQQNGGQTNRVEEFGGTMKQEDTRWPLEHAETRQPDVLGAGADDLVALALAARSQRRKPWIWQLLPIYFASALRRKSGGDPSCVWKVTSWLQDTSRYIEIHQDSTSGG